MLFKRFTLFMTFVALISLTGCGKNNNGNENGDKKEENIVPVEAAPVISGDISAYYISTTTLETEAETEVVAKVGGVVEKIRVEEGDFVKAGQILAKLDDEKLKLQVDQARASLDRLENEFNRSEELFSKKLISTETYQQAKYNLDVQKAAFKLVELDLNYTSIRAPISGVIAQRLIKVGNMVGLNQPVFRITGMDTLLAVLYVPEKHLEKFRVGQKAELSVDALADKQFEGRVKRISPVVDPSSGTVKITLESTDHSGQLKPGMFARVRVIYDVHQNAMLVPKDAILAEDRTSSVFVVRDSLVFRHEIKTGFVNTSHIEILEGVAVGDTVVTIGKGNLTDSTKVEMVNISPPKEVPAAEATAD